MRRSSTFSFEAGFAPTGAPAADAAGAAAAERAAPPPVSPRRSRVRWVATLVLPLLLLPLVALAVVDRCAIGSGVRLGGTDEMMTAYRRSPAAVVLIGNSITRTAFDENLIAARLAAAGRDWRVFKYHLSSTGPAIWFLVLKNVVLRTDPKPALVIVAGRDQELLQPFDAFSLRYSREHFPIYRSADEPVLDQKLFLQAPTATTMDEWLHRYCRLYRNRKTYQQAVGRFMFDAAMSIAGRCGGGGAQAQARIAALRRAYASESGLAAQLRARYNDPRPDVDYLNVAQDDMLNRALEQGRAFARVRGRELVERSFIPDMVAVCRAQGVRLVFVRHLVPAATRRDERWRALEEYVAGQAPEVLTLDMHGCAGITDDEFYAGSHFRATAQRKLSEYFAEQCVRALSVGDAAER